MASFAFTTAENPLSSPWSTATGGGALRATGGECANAAGSDGDAGARYSSSSVTTSIVEYRSGTFDGGPALFDSSGNGYLTTCYSGTTVEMYRMDGGFPNYNRLGGDAAVTFSAGDTAKLLISGNDVVFYKNNVETFRQTDSTHRTGLSPGIFSYAANLRTDNFTDGASAGYSLAIDQISYALTLQSVGLNNQRLTAAQISYALTLQDVSILAGMILPVAQINYTLTLQDVGTIAARPLSISQLSYALSLQDVTLTGPSNEFSLSIEQISYALSLADSLADFEMSVEQIGYALTLQDVALLSGRKVANNQLSYSLTLQDLNALKGSALQIEKLDYTLTLQDLNFSVVHAYSLACAPLSYSLEVQAVQFIAPNTGGAWSGSLLSKVPAGWWST